VRSLFLFELISCGIVGLHLSYNFHEDPISLSRDNSHIVKKMLYLAILRNKKFLDSFLSTDNICGKIFT